MQQEVLGLHDLLAPHIESFNDLITRGLDEAINVLEKQEYEINDDGAVLRYWLEDVKVGMPVRSEKDGMPFDPRVYPSEV